MFSWDDNPDLNITPLVDVMLVLMAILMITAPTITYQEQIDLPDGSKTIKVVKPKTLTIRWQHFQTILSISLQNLTRAVKSIFVQTSAFNTKM